MSNWKDTVMDFEKLAEIGMSVESFETGLLSVKVAKAQAKISFKAGEEKESTQAYSAGIHDGVLRGRRDVVAWTSEELGVDWSEEKEQLREWGLE